MQITFIIPLLFKLIIIIYSEITTGTIKYTW